ncbi:unnamed protein product [Leptidea sinapis]|uniref:Protein odr-4 homolog n=1 Tax=Leptidea sinapis TaxID=189913 RepID=A0A5E4QRI7_9NEOP|nr:unnamed protein product [Leptidea sinapis]
MVRTIYAPEYCLQYLEQYASKGPYVIGLIIGQITESRENVVHLAKTPEEKSPDVVSESSFTSEKSDLLRDILGLSETWVADHAKHVTRMLPGGLFVQGIFITSGEEIFEDPNYFSKMKSVLNYTHKALSANPYMYGSYPHSNERLILHMSTNTKVLTCKSVEVGTGIKTSIKPVEWKFLAKPQQWQCLECYFEFDDIYPVVVKKSGISVKQQFQQILESAHKTIESSVMFIDGELKQDSEPLEQINKKKKLKSSTKTAQDTPKSMNVSLFVPFQNSLPDTVEYLECDGNIHFSGVVASSVFMYPKATVREAIDAVKQDIIRSLASRFTMHSPAEALLSVKELLDVQITEGDVICDVETPADTSEFDALDGSDTCSEEILATPQEASQFMYITGICFAMFVLVVSILIHYYDVIMLFISKLLPRS